MQKENNAHLVFKVVQGLLCAAALDIFTVLKDIRQMQSFTLHPATGARLQSCPLIGAASE